MLVPDTRTLAVAAQTTEPQRNGRRPTIVAGALVDTYSSPQLLDVPRSITSDGLLRTQDALLRQAARELGYARKGAKIDRTFRSIIVNAKLG